MSKGQTKRKIITAILCVIWVILVMSLFFYRSQMSPSGEDFTTFNSAAAGDEVYYIADNNKTGGLLYVIDNTSKVLGLFSSSSHPLFKGWSVSRVCYGDNTAWVLFSKVEKRNFRDVVKLELASFDETLTPKSRSPYFELADGYRIAGFSEAEGELYLTLISVNGQEARVFGVETGALTEIKKTTLSAKEKEDFEKQTLSLREKDSRVTEPGRFFTQADYIEGTFHTRDDSQPPEGLFAIDETAKALYAGRKLTFGQRLSASGENINIYLIISLAGVVFIILISYLLFARRRVAYAIAIFELLLAICIAGTFLFILRQEKKITRESYQRFEEYALGTLFDGISDDFTARMRTGDIYSSREYALLQNRIADHIEASIDTVKLQDICVVNQSTGEVVISGSGRNRQDISGLYGKKAAEAIREVNDSTVTVLSEAVFQGESLDFMARYLADERLSGYTMLGVAAYGDVFEGFAADHYGTFRLSLVVFLVASLLGLIYFFMENYDLMRLGEGLRNLAEKGENVEKPPVFGSDMNYMWNSLFEIQKHMRISDRIKFLTYEAYYRFAPKCIERILGKDSITEVRSGDFVNLNGTLAMLTTTGISRTNSSAIDSLNTLMEFLTGELEKNDGIFVSGDSDLSMMKLLFLEESENGCRFAVDLLDQVHEWGDGSSSQVTMLMHYSPFVYGIAGTKKQAAAYLSSPEAKALEEYTEYLRSFRLGLVITGEVKEREGHQFDLRHIGYVNINAQGTGRRVELYEVLDACSVYERQGKLRLRDEFDRALELYYSEDFYFARNTFTDILRELPYDEIAKWYLFECERCLNEVQSGSFTGAITIRNT